MKSFKEYLLESKQTYDFKVKIAGECPEKCAEEIKAALSKYDVASISKGTRSPIQETHYDFPEEKNIEVTVYEVCLNYPVNSAEVRAAVADRLNKTESCIRVRNPEEEAECILNHANDEASGEALLEKPELEEVDGQSLVGNKHVMSLLKELNKDKKTLEQYKGVNDKILAKKSPSEKTAKVEKVASAKSPLGKVLNPDPRTGK
ncbi:hypothetical protein UFOVP181_400 [uncultured Caudovirales phage]|uniref:Uncharacterized protein n=1 Tax=uncultured Caudovirales phage TaxID=2100421 RepID=A0A6J5KTM4_9CAUD|nr:hypothetical protein UFOVP57_239 [uncultured Caudovirales phage]CAB5209281.1 hypothetical protein UFOVP181_400 [uncultured Caudovirales phage]